MVDERVPRLRVGAHRFDGEELEMAVRLACAAIFAGVEESEESAL